jgi:phosphoribosylamine--glycine ligase
MDKKHQKVVIPTVAGLKKDGLPYKGFIFIGLIKVGDDPKVIEYNVRLGDPETEVVIPRIKNDLVEVFQAVADQTLDTLDLKLDERTAATVMLVSGGYPEAYEKGKEITGIENVTDSLVFHAGTRLEEGRVLTNGGRVLAVTSFGKNHKEALKKSYLNIEKIRFDQMNYRMDLGFDL